MNSKLFLVEGMSLRFLKEFYWLCLLMVVNGCIIFYSLGLRVSCVVKLVEAKVRR